MRNNLGEEFGVGLGWDLGEFSVFGFLGFRYFGFLGELSVGCVRGFWIRVFWVRVCWVRVLWVRVLG